MPSLAELLVPIEKGIERRRAYRAAAERRLRTIDAQRRYLAAFDRALERRDGPMGDWLDELARDLRLAGEDDYSANARRR